MLWPILLPVRGTDIAYAATSMLLPVRGRHSVFSPVRGTDIAYAATPCARMRLPVREARRLQQSAHLTLTGTLAPYPTTLRARYAMSGTCICARPVSCSLRV
eukprot:2002499-Rhodomonas_salina.1